MHVISLYLVLYAFDGILMWWKLNFNTLKLNSPLDKDIDGSGHCILIFCELWLHFWIGAGSRVHVGSMIRERSLAWNKNEKKGTLQDHSTYGAEELPTPRINKRQFLNLASDLTIWRYSQIGVSDLRTPVPVVA
jgi:hypothetical protein